jgi:hypothetical protein
MVDSTKEGVAVIRVNYIWTGLLLLGIAPGVTHAEEPELSDRQTVIVVVGAPGSEKYGQQFQQWTALWQRAAKQGAAECITLGSDKAKNVRELFHPGLAT